MRRALISFWPGKTKTAVLRDFGRDFSSDKISSALRYIDYTRKDLRVVEDLLVDKRKVYYGEFSD
jgi:hypothetical protein